MLGDFETIPDSNNYLLAMKGIGKIVDLFLSIGGAKVCSLVLYLLFTF